jgi:head-tail adaptor
MDCAVYSNHIDADAVQQSSKDELDNLVRTDPMITISYMADVPQSYRLKFGEHELRCVNVELVMQLN